MAITLPPAAKQELVGSLKRYIAEHFDQDIGDLKAGLLLDYVLKEIGPTVYNLAIADAQGYFVARTQELDAVCFEKEFTYWADATRRKPQ
jgi:uncharacterized protein (DUF2164 family)